MTIPNLRHDERKAAPFENLGLLCERVSRGDDHPFDVQSMTMFRVPERVEEYRLRAGLYVSKPREPFGAFQMPGPCGEALTMLATDGEGPGAGDWEHVSVSTRRRIPNWREMCFVKLLFWDPEDCVMQFHPPVSQYVNVHPFTLHLWRPRDGQFPMPPRICV